MLSEFTAVFSVFLL